MLEEINVYVEELENLFLSVQLTLLKKHYLNSYGISYTDEL